MGNKSVISNFIWRFSERCGAQGVSLIVSIILARLLSPDEYGTIALVTVFIAFMQVFIDGGFGNALIQKKDADDLDFSTIFFFNMVLCILLYLIVYIASPLIANFYERIELTSIVRVLALSIVISGVKNIQQAYVTRNMLFKKFFFSTLTGTLISAVIGIIMAYIGFGVWALVTQQLTNAAIDTVILWVIVKWRPKASFSFSRLKFLASYGWKLLLSGLIATATTNIRQLVIGKVYSTGDLAYYNQGYKYPNLVIGNINASIDSVLFPAMSNHQDSVKEVKEMTRMAIKTSTYLIAPLMMGLCFTATNLIPILLTEKWNPCIPYLCIFCITFTFYPIHTANLNAIKAIGRSDIFLRLDIIKNTIGLLAIFVTMNYGVMVMAYSLLFTSFLSQIINTWPNKKILGYKYIDQLRDIFPYIALAVAMGFAVYCLNYLCLNKVLTLVLQVIVGATIYIGTSALLHIDIFEYLIKQLNIGKLKSEK